MVKKWLATTIKVLDDLRNESDFERFYTLVEKSARELNIVELPRQRRPPKRLDSGPLPHKYQSCQELYRKKKTYYKANDLITTGIRSRFDQPGYKMYAHLENLLVKRCTGDSFDEEFRIVTEFYNKDFKPADSDLHCQLSLLRSIVPKDFYPSTNGIFKLIVAQVRLFSEITQLLKLLLVLPATNATIERSFSALKKIKAVLRSTISHDKDE